MTTTTTTTPRRTPTDTPAMAWRPVLGATCGLAALLTLLLTAFAWPSSEVEPRDFPLAVVAPSPAAAGIEDRLAADAGEDAFDVTRTPDRARAVTAIEDREVAGAIVLGPDGAEVLTASAGGPAPANLLTRIGTGIAAAQGQQVTVTDVVPTASGDPRGTVFTAGALPLALGGILIGAITSVALRRTRERLVTTLLVGVVGGFALTGVLQGWLDALSGDYVTNAAVVGLGILAVALPIVGLRHLVGPAGIGLVALLVMLLGNPLSGVATGAHLVPLGWLGQLLPPGAVATALRGTAYFDGAGTTAALVTLGCWAAVGLALALVPRKEE